MDPAELRRKNFVQPDQFPYESATGFVYDSGDYETAMNLALEKIGYSELRREQEEARAEGQAVRHRTGLVHRGRGRRAGEGLRHHRHQDERRRRAPHPSDGQRDPEDQLQDPGAGARDHVRADRGRGDRDPAREDQGDARRHGQHAVRAGHLRVALHTGGGRRHRDGDAPRPREGDEARRPPARGLRGGHRVPRRQVHRARRARPRQDDPGGGVRRLHRLPRRHGGRAGGRLLLRPAQPDVPVRDLRGGRRGRRGHRRLEGAAHGGGGRLRRAHQPDDRRGADPGRSHRGLRHRGDGADHVRRERELHRLELHGLPVAHGVGDPEVRAARDGDAIAASPDRRQGRGRIRDRRLTRRLRQRGDRRPAAAGGQEHRHAAHLGQGLGRDPDGEGGQARREAGR